MSRKTLGSAESKKHVKFSNTYPTQRAKGYSITRYANRTHYSKDGSPSSNLLSRRRSCCEFSRSRSCQWPWEWWQQQTLPTQPLETPKKGVPRCHSQVHRCLHPWYLYPSGGRLRIDAVKITRRSQRSVLVSLGGRTCGPTSFPDSTSTGYRPETRTISVLHVVSRPGLRSLHKAIDV